MKSVDKAQDAVILGTMTVILIWVTGMSQGLGVTRNIVLANVISGVAITVCGGFTVLLSWSAISENDW